MLPPHTFSAARSHVPLGHLGKVLFPDQQIVPETKPNKMTTSFNA